MQKIIESLAVYWERRMARIMLLGIISGFPWVLIGSSLTLWLKEDGLSRTTIGFAGLIFGVYAINFLWAPLIDRIRIPWLTGRLGHRRAWIITLQAVILVCLAFWSLADPTANLAVVVGIGRFAAAAAEGIARQPNAAAQITGAINLPLFLLEGVAILAEVFIFLILILV